VLNLNNIFYCISLLGLGFSFGLANDAAEPQRLRMAMEKVAPAVVKIETVGGREKVDRTLIATAPFPGVVVGSEGWIVTSAYHFAHDPNSILVATPSGKRVAAKIVARDRACQLVLLKIEPEEPLTVPEVADSSRIRVGQTAIAIGMSPQGEQHIASGIVSATGRIYGRALQFDARVQTKHYGGPLIDGRGQVLGIVAPLNPQSMNELSGAEWYDSGIGFAIPLDKWLTRLQSLKSGQDLLPGLLGISLKSGDPYVLPAEVMVCQANSPAYKAGMRVNDRIVEVAGEPIERQMQLRHALGPRYAGDKVTVVALRKTERLQFDITLIERLEKFEYPMLGILPQHWPEQAGVTIRYILPKSSAEKAGLKIGDRIFQVNKADVASTLEMQTILSSLETKKPVQLQIERAKKNITLEVELQPLSSIVPADLKPESLAPPQQNQAPRSGLSNTKLPEEKNECFQYVPENHSADKALGLLVWLAPPGQFDKQEIEKKWKALAERYGFMVLVPRPAEAGKWQRDEIGILRKFIDQAMQEQTIDRTRVAILGREVSGHMAWLTALAHRNVIRGVAVLNAPLPEKTEMLNDPIDRLFVFSAHAKMNPLAKEIELGNQLLERAGIPLLKHELTETNDVSAADWEMVVRWFDTLNRL
jgi:serine protease Do